MKTRNELKAIRIALGLTQKDLAKNAEIGLNTVINFEKGCKVRPSSEKAIRTAISRAMVADPYTLAL